MSAASDNLRNNKVQLNMDGTNVCVSRQAVVEALAEYEGLLAALKIARKWLPEAPSDDLPLASSDIATIELAIARAECKS